jgi:hypothetical protein
MSTENKEPTKEATEAQANRIVAALEEILAVAIERGGVAREESYSDDEFYYPTFRDSEFNRLVLHSWTRTLNELSGDLEHNAEKLALQLDLLFVWLQDLRKELKPPSETYPTV